MYKADVGKEFEGVVVIFPTLPKYGVDIGQIKECNRISLFCRELGVVKSREIDRSQIGLWKRFHIKYMSLNGNTYEASSLQTMKTHAKFETVFNGSGEKSMYFSESGMIGDVQKHFMYIWHCYLGPVIHFAGDGEDLTKMYSSLQPVKFEAITFMDNRFAAFVAKRVSTEIRPCRFRNLHFCYEAQVSIENNNRYIAECRNGDRVVLLGPDRSLLTHCDEIKEGTLLKIAYYRIYANSKQIFVSFFLTTDKLYDDVKVFEQLHNLRSYQYDILGDEFNSAQSKSTDNLEELCNIYKEFINPWDPDREIDFSWYGNNNDNDDATVISPEVSSSTEDSDSPGFEHCNTQYNPVFLDYVEEFELSFNTPGQTGFYGNTGTTSYFDINEVIPSPPEIHLSDEENDTNNRSVPSILFDEKDTSISWNDGIQTASSSSMPSLMKASVSSNSSLLVNEAHNTRALSVLSTSNTLMDVPSLFNNTSVDNEEEIHIDFDLPSCKIKNNLEQCALSVPGDEYLLKLGMSKDQWLTTDPSKQQYLLGNILQNNLNDIERIQKSTIKSRVVRENYCQRTKSTSIMDQENAQQGSGRIFSSPPLFLSTDSRTVVAHKPRVSVFDITRNVTTSEESVYNRIDKAMEHCDSIESRYTRLLLRLLADKQEVRQQINRVNSSLYQVFINIVWNESCRYFLTDDVIKQSGLSEEEDSRMDISDLHTGIALRLVLEYRILSKFNNIGILQNLMGNEGFELLDDVPQILGKRCAKLTLSHSIE